MSAAVACRRRDAPRPVPDEVKSHEIASAPQLTCGSLACCAVVADGTLRCWGQGPFQLYTPTTIAPAEGPKDFVRVAVGVHHACALRRGGEVDCFGSDDGDGQLGDGGGEAHADPRPVKLDGPATSIVTGAHASCALLADGRAQCWGPDDDGQLGDGTIAPSKPPVSVDASGHAPFVELGIGIDHACAREASGGVLCWGRDDHGQLGDGVIGGREPKPVRVVGIHASALAVGDQHTCALLTDATVDCWGLDRHHELGDGALDDRATPAPVPGLTDVEEIAAGDAFHACARTKSGRVACWGWNEDYQIGDGTTLDRATPYFVRGLPPAVQLTLGFETTCARLDDRSAACWGDNAHGTVTGIARLDELELPKPTIVSW